MRQPWQHPQGLQCLFGDLGCRPSSLRLLLLDQRGDSEACYLFSICICRLSDVKLARRSVTSSTCSFVLVICSLEQRSSSCSFCSCLPRRSRYSRNIWIICFTSRRTASRLWEIPSCKMFSFDFARCSGVLPARSKASTLAPPRSSVVMTGTWFVQAAGKGKHRTHNSEVLANNKGVSAQAWNLSLLKRLFLPSERGTAPLLSITSCSGLGTFARTHLTLLRTGRGREMDFL